MAKKKKTFTPEELQQIDEKREQLVNDLVARRSTSKDGEKLSEIVDGNLLEDSTGETPTDKRNRVIETLKSDKKRYYSFSCVTYLVDEIACYGSAIEKCNHYAHIVHWADSTDKHIHIMITFPRMYTIAQVYEMLTSSEYWNGENVQVEKLSSPEKMGEYFLHKNNPEKHQYRPNEIQMDCEEYWRTRTKIFDAPTVKGNDNDEFITDLVNSTFTEMCRKYGRDFMKNHKQYIACKHIIECEMKYPNMNYIDYYLTITENPQTLIKEK